MSAPPIDRIRRLIGLWVSWLLAMLFHVELGLMPLFHGVSPEIETKVPPGALPALYWAMLIFFALPVVALILTSYAPAGPIHPGAWKDWPRIQFWFSVVYTVANGMHLISDIVVPDGSGDQVALVAAMMVIGLLINREAWCWWQECRSSQKVPSASATDTHL
jgi:hypothetical protein